MAMENELAGLNVPLLTCFACFVIGVRGVMVRIITVQTRMMFRIQLTKGWLIRLSVLLFSLIIVG